MSPVSVYKEADHIMNITDFEKIFAMLFLRSGCLFDAATSSLIVRTSFSR